jgi:hypothetical protein
MDETESARMLLQPHLAHIHSWEQTANEILILNVTLGILGVVTGLLQKAQKNWGKVATIIIGGTISILTVINNTAFDVDRRTLRQRAVTGYEIVQECETMFSEGIPAEQNAKSLWYGRYRKLLHELNQLPLDKQEKAEPTNTTSVSLRDFIPPVHAAMAGQSEPSWVSTPPKNDSLWYFIGAGSDVSLESAQSSAKNDAFSRARTYLSSKLSDSSNGTQVPGKNTFADYILKSAVVSDTYSTYDSNKKLFRSLVLMQINKNDAQTDIKLFGLEHQTGGQQQQASLFLGTQTSYPPAVNARENASSLAEYPLREKHFVTAGNLGIYASHIHRSIRTRLFIFSNLHDLKVDTQREFGYDDATRIAKQAGAILIAKDMHDGEKISFTMSGNEYLVVFRYSGSAKATLTLQGNLSALNLP